MNLQVMQGTILNFLFQTTCPRRMARIQPDKTGKPAFLVLSSFFVSGGGGCYFLFLVSVFPVWGGNRFCYGSYHNVCITMIYVAPLFFSGCSLVLWRATTTTTTATTTTWKRNASKNKIRHANNKWFPSLRLSELGISLRTRNATPWNAALFFQGWQRFRTAQTGRRQGRRRDYRPAHTSWKVAILADTTRDARSMPPASLCPASFWA